MFQKTYTCCKLQNNDIQFQIDVLFNIKNVLNFKYSVINVKKPFKKNVLLPNKSIQILSENVFKKMYCRNIYNILYIFEESSVLRITL